MTWKKNQPEAVPVSMVGQDFELNSLSSLVASLCAELLQSPHEPFVFHQQQ